MSRRVQLPIASEAPPEEIALVQRYGNDGADGPPLDSLGRGLTDLRISVTDRCNFRCGYCMPKEVFGPGFRFLPRPQILSFEEIARAASVFVALGVRKLRLTGGEPLLRTHLDALVRLLAPLDVDLALTTNGSLLAKHATSLATAGLRRVTISLDALDEAVFRRMNDVDFPVASVLTGVDAALAAGLPVKINCVVRKGYNDDQIVPLARHFNGTGVVLRFIEFMDVGTTNGWNLEEVVTGAQIIERIDGWSPLQALERSSPTDVARRWRYTDGSGEVGLVTSVTQPFCGDCTRARLSAEGKLFTCLFAGAGHDLRPLLRGPSSDSELVASLHAFWALRRDRYSQLRAESRAPGGPLSRVEMSYIGG